MIEKMNKYSFILLKGETEDFLAQLQELGLMDITRSSKAVDDKSSELIKEAEELRSYLSWLKAGDFSKDPAYAEILARRSAKSAEAAAREPWGDFDIKAIEGLEAIGYKTRFYCVPAKKFNPEWVSSYPLQIISNDGSNVWFVTVTGEADAILPIAECAPPKGSAEQARKELTAIQMELDEREKELQEIQKGVPALEKSYEEKLAGIELYLAGATKESAAADSIDVMVGFAPEESQEAIDRALDLMGTFYIKEAAQTTDKPPIKLRNNKFVKMFELFTDMYGRPEYDGFDPTPYISIFFLLFFAMCMGDCGYGLVLIAVGFLLKKVKSFADISPLVVTLGIATTVIGFFFHTFFSVDMTSWSVIPEGVKALMVPAKIAGYDGTMVVAIAVGIIHLCLAMIVKTVYATRNKGVLNSLSIWGWTVLIVGGVIVGAVALAGVIDAALTKIIVIALGVASAVCIFLLNDLHRNPLLNIGAGLWETYNTATGLLGDVLSYLRIYALGLAGCMLGFAFNDLAKMALGDGGFGWVPFVVIVLIGHTLNLAMAALGAFVHPLRLNFLEFFKNSGYEGSGRRYNPLKK